MSISPVSAITRRSTRKPNELLNILTFVTHERFEPELCQTNHSFFSFRDINGTRDWNTNVSEVPNNYHIINNFEEIPLDIDFDLIITQNPFVHIPLAIKLKQQLGLPILNISHTMPHPNYEENEQAKELWSYVDKHIFISEYNKLSWGLEGSVVHHSIDSNFWKPIEFTNIDRQNKILVVANDYIGRDWALGFSLYKHVLDNKLPTEAVGDTANLSHKSKNKEELLEKYQMSRIFLNTSLHSPIPMALLEAAACGCGIVTTNTCLIPEFFKHRDNALIFDPKKPEKMLEYLNLLRQDKDMATELGNNARAMVQEQFSRQRFIREYNEVLYEAADTDS